MRSRKSYLKKYFDTIVKKEHQEAFSGKISKEGTITNVYSIINLKRDGELPLMDENAQMSIGPVYHMFINEFIHIDKTLDMDILKSSKEVYVFDKNHGISIPLARKISDIIKPDQIEVRLSDREFQGPVIYLRNSQTEEDAYLLPTMRY